MPRATAADLPMPLLSQVLQHIPLQQRLSSCALVCNTWATAAAAATSSINLTMLPTHLPALRLWMLKHSRYLQHLHLKQRGLNVFTSVPPKLLQLHLPAHQLTQLTSLNVTGFVPRLQLSMLKRAMQEAAAATGSDQLVAASGSSAAAVSQSTAGRGAGSRGRGRGNKRGSRGRGRAARLLQDGSSGGNGSSNAAGAMSLQPLPQLQQLRLTVPIQSTKAILQFTQCVSVTKLHLDALGFRDCPVTQEPPDQTRKVSALLTSLSRLQDLSVTSMFLEESALRALSSSSLTSLKLDSTIEHSYMGRDQTVCIPINPMPPQLAQMRVLHITRDEFNPAVLACMPQLQELAVYGAHLVSSTVEDDAAYVRPEAALMTALAQLQHLHHLVVKPTVEYPRKHDPMLSTALTTSSHLTHLEIVHCEAAPWEMGITKHVFPHGKVWPDLQVLQLETGTKMYDKYGDEYYPDHCLDADDLRRLLHACPALRSLTLKHVVDPRSEASAQALLDLPESCVDLALAGRAFGDSAAAVLCQLTQIRSLNWDDTPALTMAGLAQLTALKALTSLNVNEEFEERRDPYLDDEGDEIDYVRLHLTEEAWTPVWLQLHTLCDKPKDPVATLQQVDEGIRSYYRL